MQELLDNPKRLDELPEEFRINRYSFRFDLDTDSFAVRKEKTISFTTLFGTVLFGGVAAFLLFFVLSYTASDGWGGGSVFLLVLSGFMFALALSFVYFGYIARTVFLFHPDHLLVKRTILGEKRYEKSVFQSVYILAITTNNSSGVETNYSVDICLKYPLGYSNFSSHKKLFSIDDASNAWTLFTTKTEVKRQRMNEEAERIGRIIELYWDIPFRT